MPEDTFVTRDIGYVYDALPPPPPARRHQLRAIPYLAVFEGVDHLELGGQSYVMHVFVVPKDDAGKFRVPGDQDMWAGPVYY